MLAKTASAIEVLPIGFCDRALSLVPTSVEIRNDVGSAMADTAKRHRKYKLEICMLLLVVGCGMWEKGWFDMKGDLE